MKQSLIYSLPILLTACGDGFTSTNPHKEEDLDKEEVLQPYYIPPTNKQCISTPQEEVLQPYYEFLVSHDKITEAIRFCDYSAALQQKMWAKIVEAEQTGLPPTAPLPQSYVELLDYESHFSQRQLNSSQSHFFEYFPAEYVIRQWNSGRLEEKIEVVLMDAGEPVTKIYVTKEEAHEIYAAHLAHSLWLEKNEIVPWSIIEYTQTQLEQLLQPTAWFRSWDDDKEQYSFHLILDHSPRETFTVAEEAVSSFSNQRAAMDDIIKSVRPFQHGAVQVDSEGNVMGGDPQGIVTIPTMKEELTSRHGCQTMSPYIVQIANSLNIPGKYINGYYAAAGHRSALFDFTDDVLAHGDDVYFYNYLGNTPSSEVMDSHDFWEENVMVHPKGDTTAAHNSMLHTYRKAMQYPAHILISNYCRDGREFLDDKFLHHEFGPFAIDKDIDDLEKRILELSNNCTRPYPENNPDK